MWPLRQSRGEALFIQRNLFIDPARKQFFTRSTVNQRNSPSLNAAAVTGIGGAEMDKKFMEEVPISNRSLESEPPHPEAVYLWQPDGEDDSREQ